ncbi:MAG: hypothetical protein V4586_16575 [Pseudomonadota bacterium]
MKPFATALLLTIAATTQASAFSMNLSLPDLSFPPTTTSISSQNAALPGK